MTPDGSTIDDRDGRRRNPLGTILLVALLAFVVGAGVVTWALTRWAPARALIAQPPTSAPVAPLVTAPGPVIDAPPAVATDASITESRVAGLEARLAQIDAQASGAAANAARAEGLLIAFAARRAIDRGAALGYLEGQVRDRFAASQPRAVAAVIAAAQSPVTLDLLRQRLDVLAPKLVGGGSGESWSDTTRRIVGNLFVVRRADAPSPVPDERILRARMALSAGQADNALAEIARLPTRAAANDWMAMARRYIEAHRALDILEASALTAGPPHPTNTGKPA